LSSKHPASLKLPGSMHTMHRCAMLSKQAVHDVYEQQLNLLLYAPVWLLFAAMTGTCVHMVPPQWAIPHKVVESANVKPCPLPSTRGDALLNCAHHVHSIVLPGPAAGHAHHTKEKQAPNMCPPPTLAAAAAAGNCPLLLLPLCWWLQPCWPPPHPQQHPAP
jgi:hypothetical protein